MLDYLEWPIPKSYKKAEVLLFHKLHARVLSVQKLLEIELVYKNS